MTAGFNLKSDKLKLGIITKNGHDYAIFYTKHPQIQKTQINLNTEPGMLLNYKVTEETTYQIDSIIRDDRRELDKEEAWRLFAGCKNQLLAELE